MNMNFIKKLIHGDGTNVSVNQELQNFNFNEATLVDVRTELEFREGSADGAVNIPLDQIINRLDEFEDEKHIVVFCRSGNRSGQAQEILKNNGVSNVTNGGTWEDVKKIQARNEN